MASKAGPVPSPPPDIDPLRITWKAGRRLYRVHSEDYSPTAFNPGRGRPGRFHPIVDRDGMPIATLYAADRIDGALSETVFHSLVAGGVILRAQLESRYISEIELTEDLAVANLTGHGLRRIGLNRTQLIEIGPAHYAATARWAEAVHHCDDDIAGLVWVSRQFDTSKALVAFGDRVGGKPFVAKGVPRTLHRGPGYRLVQKAAAAADITIVEG